jgi:transcriptional regulator with XRE-family HTH domain
VKQVTWKVIEGMEEKMAEKITGKKVDIPALGEAIKRRRAELDLSLRDVADRTGVSASTLSRIENGTGRPDAETIAVLSDWLDIPVQRIIKSGEIEEGTVIYTINEPLPDIVEAHLRADKSMSPEMANALSEMFRVAYRQFGGKVPSADETEEKK